MFPDDREPCQTLCPPLDGLYTGDSPCQCLVLLPLRSQSINLVKTLSFSDRNNQTHTPKGPSGPSRKSIPSTSTRGPRGSSCRASPPFSAPRSSARQEQPWPWPSRLRHATDEPASSRASRVGTCDASPAIPITNRVALARPGLPGVLSFPSLSLSFSLLPAASVTRYISCYVEKHTAVCTAQEKSLKALQNIAGPRHNGRLGLSCLGPSSRRHVCSRDIGSI
ncbi:hypothetical protein LX36DRAFT_465711 [Colletotrichum falcatum]|nr:hypothetical protein LX36DRAFT_465711 [Colletotrichum falcatum]